MRLVLLLALLPSVAHAQLSGGPDAGGYVYYETAFGLESVTHANADLDGEGTLVLPWTFPWYGETLDTIVLDEDGALGLTATFPIGDDNACGPGLVAQIAPFWDDLAGSVQARILTSPDRVAVEWDHVNHATAGGDATFQVHLFADGHVEFHYDDVDFGDADVDFGASATVRIQDLLGTVDLTVSCDEAALSDGLALLFEPCVDDDSDGSCRGLDCDDDDPANVPGGVEVCDGQDNDCDGAGLPGDVDEDGDGALACDECDDDDPANFPGNPEACDGQDNDCDGATAAAGGEDDADSDGSLSCADCDDDDPLRTPAAPELCDTIDNDCDGAVPGDEVDDDADGYLACADCNDADPAVSPDATETCDGIDDDCDGMIEGSVELGAVDLFGTTSMFRNLYGYRFEVDVPVVFEGMRAQFSADEGATVRWVLYSAPLPIGPWSKRAEAAVTYPDGADTSAWLTSPDLPWALEPGTLYFAGLWTDDPLAYLRFTLDDDPDYPVELGVGRLRVGSGVTNVGPPEPSMELGPRLDGYAIRLLFGAESDWDGDGFLGCEECDDLDAARAPDREELCDGIDNDCSGAPDADAGGEVDGDGDGSLSCEDCDDADAINSPDFTEICDGLENDCDPGTNELLDGDGDGTSVCAGDCDDADATIGPGLTELCNGLDDDCDPDTSEEEDNDGDGVSACGGDCDDTDPAFGPSATELCDGRDGDCDGVLPQDEADADNDGFMPCEGDCDDTTDAAHPERGEAGADLCADGIDNDCDGLVDAADGPCAPEVTDPPDEYGGCACGTATSGRWAALLLLLLPRRRRSRLDPPARLGWSGAMRSTALVLLSLLLLAISAPESPALSADEEERLAAGKVVVQPDLPPARDKGVRARAIAEIDAPPQRVWDALLDFQARVPENKSLVKVEIYEDAWSGDVLRRKARWDLKVFGTDVVFHNDYVLDRAQSYLEWNLDDGKENDLVFSWGSYQVLDSPIHPGKSRLVYVSESDSGRTLPKWIKKEIAEGSMEKLIAGIRDRAQR
jgi:hypothetical protein